MSIQKSEIALRHCVAGMSDNHLTALRLPPFGLIGNSDGGGSASSALCSKQEICGHLDCLANPTVVCLGSYSGEIDHTDFLSDNIGSLFLNQNFSDVTFVVDGEKFPAHKVLLAARSEYFRYVCLSYCGAS